MSKSVSSFESSLSFAVSAFHSYASFFCGWYFFNEFIYPVYYLPQIAADNLKAELPVYLLNVMAFYGLFYVATRPLAILLTEIITSFSRFLEGLLNK